MLLVKQEQTLNHYVYIYKKYPKLDKPASDIGNRNIQRCVHTKTHRMKKQKFLQSFLSIPCVFPLGFRAPPPCFTRFLSTF